MLRLTLTSDLTVAPIDIRERDGLEPLLGRVPLPFRGSLRERAERNTRARRAIVQTFFASADGGVTPCICSLINEGEDWKIEGSRFMRRIRTVERIGVTRV